VSDVIFLATIVAFFALCVAYIRACDWIIGPDTEFELEVDGGGGSGDPVDALDRAA
jgi:hypothetical protein